MSQIPGVGGQLRSKVEFYISCRGLINMDLMSKSDPFAVVYYRDTKTGVWAEMGRTETIMDNLNPDFTKQFVMDYFFEEVQVLRFDVYDLDSPSRHLKDHDFIGSFETTLGHVMGSRGQTASGELVLTNPNAGVVGTRGSTRGGGGGGGGRVAHPHRLQKKNPHQRGGGGGGGSSRGSFSSRVMGAFRGKSKSRGRLVVRAEEVSGCADVARFAARGLNLDRKNWFGLGHADPFLSIYRSREDGQWVRVWQSDVIKHTINPTWKPAAVPVQQICNGDLDRPIMLEVLDWESSGSHGMIGRVTTSLRAIVDPPGGRGAVRFTLVNDALRKKKGKAYKGSGTLEFYRADVLRQHTLLEYVRGGTELALMAAVDFTASNGAPSLASSLHYRNPMAPNEYQQAIRAVGEILMEYDSDKQVPLWGFGGQINGRVDHCFPLTFDPTHDEVDGVQGMLAAYANSFQFVSLSGPTLFSKIIAQAAHRAAEQRCSQQNQQYNILLILTDGVINDMDATIAQVVNASVLPLSIIIVGVGNADFRAMETLDADDERLRDLSTGRVQQRDTVQFVPFRQYKGSPAALARDVLAEIPQQLVGYFKSKGIVPNPPQDASNRHLAIPQARPAVPNGGGGGGGAHWGTVQRAVQQGNIPVATAVAPPVAPGGRRRPPEPASRPPPTAPPSGYAL